MRHASIRLSAALWGVCLTLGSVAAQPPIHPTPGYHHDRFVTLPHDHLQEFQAYIASFDTSDDDDGDGQPDSRGAPEWVAYQLDLGEPHGAASKPGKWRTVPALPADTASPTDASYSGSSYSRGHMCMRDHAHRLGSAANYHTFNVINACPQKQAFNAGHWLGLEKLTGEWADVSGSVWIVCGPIFNDRRASKWIGDAGEVPVAVPDGFFKIVVRESANPDRPDVLAFAYQHDPHLNDSSRDVDHSEFLVSVDWIEDQTGLDFLTDLDEAVEEEIEREPAPEVWSLDRSEDRPAPPVERLAAPASPRGPPPSAERTAPVPLYVNGRVTFVPDGDTVHIQQDGTVFKVRLHAVDCPESDQSFGPQAREFTQSFIGDREVTVKVQERDRYGRYVGEVFVDGHSLNRELARRGLAWWYDRYAREDRDVERLALGARSARIGLWSEQDPIPPWEWRAGR